MTHDTTRRAGLISTSLLILLVAILPAAALAGPTSPPDYGTYNPANLANQPPEEWGVEKVIPSPNAPGGASRIVTDPLESDDGAAGWVTFWCQSTLGFQYNIGATGLSPLARHTVHALGASFAYVTEDPGGAPWLQIEPGLWINLASFQAEDLPLGTFKTDAKGSGGVKGALPLSAGRAYDVATIVSDANGVPVLWSPSSDTNGFIVY